MKHIFLFLSLLFAVQIGQSQETWNTCNSTVTIIPAPSYDSTFVLSAPSRAALAKGMANWTPSTSGGVVEGTYSAIQTLITNSALEIGSLYKITDRGDRGIFLTAISTDEFAPTGYRLMLVPKTYQATAVDGNQWLGVWQPSLSPSTGDLAIWAGHVWENVAGNVGASNNDSELDAEWSVVSKSTFSNSEYIERIFGIVYDFDNDWIESQWDDNGNIFGKPYVGPGENLVDVSDWNFVTRDPDFRKNRMDGFINNIASSVQDNILIGYSMRGNICSSSIVENIMTGDITYNVCATIGYNTCFDDISGNEISGIISYNRCLAIEDNVRTSCDISHNANPGEITENTGSGSIEYNFNIGNISGNECGAIYRNTNLGNINNNTHDGTIYLNSNAGYITNCTGSGGFNVFSNINNGNINNPAGLTSANVTDAIVNK